VTAADLLLIVGALLIVCSVAWIALGDVVAVTLSGGAVVFLFGFWAYLAERGGE
jgi:hypothetical protein